jgi:RNase H-fold protein (predicted Holliday junction resolvase)
MKNYFDLKKIKNRITEMKIIEPKKKILGVDFGTQKIGLAVFSFETKIISPFGVYKRIKSIENIKDLNFFLDLIERQKIHTIIIGASLVTDFRGDKEILRFGNKRLFDMSLEFFQKLKEILSEKIEFAFFDESFSSVFANQDLYEYGFSRSKIRKNEDGVAASKILGDALEEMSFYIK